MSQSVSIQLQQPPARAAGSDVHHPIGGFARTRSRVAVDMGLWESGSSNRHRCEPGWMGRMEDAVRTKRDEAGAATVEFAILLVLLMMIVYGMLEFGIGFFQASGANAGVREAARRAAVGAIATCHSGPFDLTTVAGRVAAAADLYEIVQASTSGVPLALNRNDALHRPQMKIDDANGDHIIDAGDSVTVWVPYKVDLSGSHSLVPLVPNGKPIDENLYNNALAVARVENVGGITSC